ncbi:hypothetical protein BJ741DRAFT_681372 [Chytriomyces cf. hyalinus JEL632]|nr:hypothetical protein BJ741DRAFT_681372 [Chytriomyces cf. hyalinus JEL632]
MPKLPKLSATIASLHEERRSPSTLSLPVEVAWMVLLHLPIDEHILDVACASRLFSQMILCDAGFVRKHIESQTPVSTDDAEDFYANAVRQCNKLPLLYLKTILVDIFENPHWFGDSFLSDLFCTVRLTKVAAWRLSSSISWVLGESGISQMLEWMCDDYSSEAVMAVLKRHPKTLASHRFMRRAVSLGWKDVVALLVLRGFNVSHERNDILVHAVSEGDCDIVATLLQDSRIDLSLDNYRLLHLAESLEVTQTLLSDERIPSGHFVLSVVAGDTSAVSKHVSSSQVRCTVSNNLALFLAVRFNHASVLQVLLTDERLPQDATTLQRHLQIAAQDGNWDVFHAILANPRFQFQGDVARLLALLLYRYNASKDDPHADAAFKAMDAFLSRDSVARWMRPAHWRILYSFVCSGGSRRCQRCVLSKAGTFNITSSPGDQFLNYSR